MYLYNSRPCDLTVILTDAYSPDPAALNELCGAAGGAEVQVICWHGKKLPTSYLPEDAELLLTDITGKLEPLPAKEREPLIQSGVHYSELLPAEYRPSDAYFREYENGLKLWAKPNADAVRTVAETIWAEKGRHASGIAGAGGNSCRSADKALYPQEIRSFPAALFDFDNSRARDRPPRNGVYSCAPSG